MKKFPTYNCLCGKLNTVPEASAVKCEDCSRMYQRVISNDKLTLELIYHPDESIEEQEIHKIIQTRSTDAIAEAEDSK